MRRPNDDHLQQPWRVHALVPDFELLDVWRFPVVAADEVPLATFIGFLAAQQAAMVSGRSPAALLFRLRAVLGRLFGWDEEPAGRADADARDPESVRRRLDDDEHASPSVAESKESEPRLPFDVVYADEDERLAEIQNATVHALMHIGRVPVDGGWSPQMAVYVKRRGVLGRLYMALIGPFRHAIVYPAMMRSARRGWDEHLARHP